MTLAAAWHPSPPCLVPFPSKTYSVCRGLAAAAVTKLAAGLSAVQNRKGERREGVQLTGSELLLHGMPAGKCACHAWAQPPRQARSRCRASLVILVHAELLLDLQRGIADNA